LLRTGKRGRADKTPACNVGFTLRHYRCLSQPEVDHFDRELRLCSMSSAALELIAKARELTLAMMLEGDGGAFTRLYRLQRVISATTS
jgi:hypothetical protein